MTSVLHLLFSTYVHRLSRLQHAAQRGNAKGSINRAKHVRNHVSKIRHVYYIYIICRIQLFRSYFAMISNGTIRINRYVLPTYKYVTLANCLRRLAVTHVLLLLLLMLQFQPNPLQLMLISPWYSPGTWAGRRRGRPRRRSRAHRSQTPQSLPSLERRTSPCQRRCPSPTRNRHRDMYRRNRQTPTDEHKTVNEHIF